MMQLVTKRAIDMGCDMPTAARTPMPELMYWQSVYEEQMKPHQENIEPTPGAEPQSVEGQQSAEQMWCVLDKAFGYDVRKHAKRKDDNNG